MSTLRLQKKKDGYWLDIKSGTKSASINIVSISPMVLEVMNEAVEANNLDTMGTENKDLKERLMDVRDQYDGILNYGWGKLYPGKTDWEYPGQVINHLWAEIEIQRNKVTELEKRNVDLTGEVEHWKNPRRMEPGEMSAAYTNATLSCNDEAIRMQKARIAELEGELHIANEDANNLADYLATVLSDIPGVVWEEVGESTPVLIQHKNRISHE